MKIIKYILLFLFSFFYNISAYADDFLGFIALEGRGFLKSPQYQYQKDNNNINFLSELEYYKIFDENFILADAIFAAKLFARYDLDDKNRSHIDARQFDVIYVKDDYEFTFGISKIFWGVAESNHLVDIINQTDNLEDVDSEDKLGQPMIKISAIKDWGTFSLFYLPYFREQKFIGKRGRLRSVFQIDEDIVTYDSKYKRWHPDIAIRYENVIDNFDIGLALFIGNDRSPTFLDYINPNDNKLYKTPKYSIINQASLDLQYTGEEWLLKLESKVIDGYLKKIYAYVFGFEYSIYDIASSGIDLGLISEYSYDSRGNFAPVSLLQNDLFLGARLSFNDENDFSILAGSIIDLENNIKLFQAELSRRIYDNFKLEIDARIYTNIGALDLESAFKKDDHVQMRISYYF